MGLDGVVPEGHGRARPAAGRPRRTLRPALRPAPPSSTPSTRSWLPDRRAVVLRGGVGPQPGRRLRVALDAGAAGRPPERGARATPTPCWVTSSTGSIPPPTPSWCCRPPPRRGLGGWWRCGPRRSSPGCSGRPPPAEPATCSWPTSRRRCSRWWGRSRPTAIEGRAFGIESAQGFDRVGSLDRPGGRRRGPRRPAARRGPGRDRRPGAPRGRRGRRRPPAAPGPAGARPHRRRHARGGAGHLPGRPPRRRAPGRRPLRRRRGGDGGAGRPGRVPGRAALARHRDPRRAGLDPGPHRRATCWWARRSRSTPCSATPPRSPAASPASATWPSPCSARRP